MGAGERGSTGLFRKRLQIEHAIQRYLIGGAICVRKGNTRTARRSGVLVMMLFRIASTLFQKFEDGAWVLWEGTNGKRRRCDRLAAARSLGPAVPNVP